MTPPQLKELMPHVDAIVFQANGHTVAVMVGGETLPIGLDGVDHKLLAGNDPHTESAIVHLMEHVTGGRFRVDRDDGDVRIYRRS